MLSKFKEQKAQTTAFSEFFRSASAGEKKKVFSKVLEVSTAEQQKVIKQAQQLKSA